jgi:hypothetical protein
MGERKRSFFIVLGESSCSDFLLNTKIEWLAQISPPEEEEYSASWRGEVVFYRCSSWSSLQKFLAGRIASLPELHALVL